MRRVLISLLTIALSLVFVSAQTPSDCPTISVTSPPGIVLKTPAFTAEISGKVPENTSLNWNVSKGRILDGQGTKRILIDYEPEGYEYSITATLEVGGLPAGCPNKVSEMYSVVIDPGPELLADETLTSSFYQSTLSKTIHRLKEDSNAYLYIIEYRPREATPAELKKRIGEIAKFLKQALRQDSPFFKLVIVPRPDKRVRIYLIAPGVNDPNP
jgi:hypothetical protein